VALLHSVVLKGTLTNFTTKSTLRVYTSFHRAGQSIDGQRS
jgi:hypothetical protein